MLDWSNCLRFFFLPCVSVTEFSNAKYPGLTNDVEFFFLEPDWFDREGGQSVKRRKGREGGDRDHPTNIGITGATPTATTLVVISDGGQNFVALGCSKGYFSLKPALALGQTITKCTLEILVGQAKKMGADRARNIWLVPPPTQCQPEMVQSSVKSPCSSFLLPHSCLLKKKSTFFFLNCAIRFLHAIFFCQSLILRCRSQCASKPVKFVIITLRNEGLQLQYTIHIQLSMSIKKMNIFLFQSNKFVKLYICI